MQPEKSLAVGVVEHGQTTLLDLLDRTISALYRTSIDENHLSRGFAALLGHLQAQCKPRLLSRLPTTNPSVPPSTLTSPVQPSQPSLHAQPPTSLTCGSSVPTTCSAQLPTLYPPTLSQTLSQPHHPPVFPPQATDQPFPWDWDPTSDFIAVGREQDLLFQSLWNDGGVGGGGDFNIMGTLLGDNFGTGEFGADF